MSDNMLMQQQNQQLQMQAPLKDAALDQTYKDLNTQELTFNDTTYKVRYSQEFTQEATRRILSDDQALEDYYTQYDPRKLDGLQSKFFLNFPGKKSERKRLRKEYIDNMISTTRAKEERILVEERYAESLLKKQARDASDAVFENEIAPIKTPLKEKRDKRLNVINAKIFEKVQTEIKAMEQHGDEITKFTPEILRQRFETPFRPQMDEITQEYEAELEKATAEIRAKYTKSLDGQFKEIEKSLRTAPVADNALSEEEYQRQRTEKRNSDMQIIDTYYRTFEPHKAEAIWERVLTMDLVELSRFAELIDKKKMDAINLRKEKQVFKNLKVYTESYCKHVKGMTPGDIKSQMNTYLMQSTDAALEDTWRQIQEKEKDQFDAFVKSLDTTEDTEEIRQKQDDYAKAFSTKNTYQSYRLLQRYNKAHEDIDFPDAIKKDLEKSKPKYNIGDYNRTCQKFLKPVKYIEENGVKKCATKQDEENLKFNNDWAASLLSDNEKDWEFRFKYMEQSIDEMFDTVINKHGLENICDPQYSADHLEELCILSDRTLILSGLNHLSEQNNFFKSAYFKSLTEERRNELSQKSDILTTFSSIFTAHMQYLGADVDKGKLMEGERYQDRMKEYIDYNVTLIGEQLRAFKGE